MWREKLRERHISAVCERETYREVRWRCIACKCIRERKRGGEEMHIKIKGDGGVKRDGVKTHGDVRDKETQMRN